MSDFEEIKKELLQCRLCENIFPHEPRPIFQGNPHAKIFQISQAPSIHVHESGLPFNDASGKPVSYTHLIIKLCQCSIHHKEKSSLGKSAYNFSN